MTEPSEPALAAFRRIVGASIAGPSHVLAGLPCQDAWASRTLPSGSSVLAVADGLGSAPGSAEGARTAVEAAVASAAASLEAATAAELTPVLLEAVRTARRAVDQRATDLGCDVHDLACTLIVCVVRGDSAGAAHIGDGAVVVETAAGLEVLSEPGATEYVNEVVPLTSTELETAVRTSIESSGVVALAAFTDGCQRAGLVREEGELRPFPGFFGPIFAFASRAGDPLAAADEIAALLASPRISALSEDDKTLVVVCPERAREEETR